MLKQMTMRLTYNLLFKSYSNIHIHGWLHIYPIVAWLNLEGLFLLCCRFVTAIMFGKSKSKKKGLEISSPSNFQHRVHTGFDREQGVFVGLPAQWAGIIGNDSSRPRPIVDPSQITHMDVTPLKVSATIRTKSNNMFVCRLSSLTVAVLYGQYVQRYSNRTAV